MKAEIQLDYIFYKEDALYHIHPALLGFIEDKLKRDPFINHLKAQNENNVEEKVKERLIDLICENIKFDKRIFENTTSEEKFQILEIIINSILLAIKKKYRSITM